MGVTAEQLREEFDAQFEQEAARINAARESAEAAQEAAAQERERTITTVRDAADDFETAREFEIHTARAFVAAREERFHVEQRLRAAQRRARKLDVPTPTVEPLEAYVRHGEGRYETDLRDLINDFDGAVKKGW
jgi:hypothetical protein